MSENLKQFFDLMNNDPEIKEKALTCNELGKEKVRLALIELAKESGIELSEADFVEQPVESEELDMEELGAVVGGAGICLCAMAGGGGGTDTENGKTYGCACVGYGQGGDGRISDANCACVAMGEGHDDYKCY